MQTKPWTKYEIKALRAAAKRGISSSYAAGSIDRSPGAIRFKAAMLGIRFHSLGRKHSRSQKSRYSKGAK